MTNCSIKGCRKPQHSSGFCNPHYQLKRRHGSPLINKKPQVLMPWILETSSSGSRKCIPWPFKSKSGCPQVYFQRRRQSVARVVLMIKHGISDPPKDLPFAIRTCKTLNCCNPNHLKWGTREETRKHLNPQTEATLTGYRMTIPGASNWLFLGIRPIDVARAIRAEIEQNEALSPEEIDSFTVEAFQTTATEIAELPDFPGW